MFLGYKDTDFCNIYQTIQQQNSIFCNMSDKKNISSRFIEVLNELLKRGSLPDKKAFALSVGCSTSMITEISKGRSNVGVSLLQNTVQNYGVSATWLLVGTGEMFASEEQDTQNSSSAEPMVDKLLSIINKKDDIIRQQAEEIGQLRAELAQLKQRLQKSADAASTNHTANAG